ncbi:MAG TPA: universal stress protein, partial [Desulfobacterales bacterium]|nr:universal stress protein [Desulfobacterales bacterium]
GARITALHVIEDISPGNAALVDAYLREGERQKFFEQSKAFVTQQLQGRFQALCEKEYPDDPDCLERLLSIEVSSGYPAEVILEKAKALDSDLIVMGTHGKGFISQTFLGSMAKRVLARTRRPVFIVPLPKETPAA